MQVSVVIVSYNTKGLTLSCIESVQKHSLGLEVELVIVDNGSTDGSAQAIRRLKSHKLKTVENAKNLGFAKGVNQAVKVASGKHILLLNSDCELKPGALKKLFDFAEKTPDAGAIGAKLLNPEGDVQPSCYYFPGIVRSAKRYFGGVNEVDKYYPKSSGARDVEAVVFAAVVITRAALNRVGLLNERYFMYFEDLDFCKRIWKSGLKVYFLPSVEVFHHHGASGRDIAGPANQWRRLIPSSKIYHGVLKHYLIFAIMWLGQKWEKLLKRG